MKRGKGKRVFAVVLALSMILSLAGCGNKPTESTTAPDAGKTQGGIGAHSEGKRECLKLRAEFSYFGPLWKPYKESTPIFDELMKRTGITVNFEWANEEGFDTAGLQGGGKRSARCDQRRHRRA